MSNGRKEQLMMIHPYPWILGPSPSPIGTKVIKCADRVPAGLCYDAYLKWHMPIWGEIGHSEQKFMPFWDRHLASLPSKQSNTQQHVQIEAMLRLDFFGKRARWRSRFFLFSRYSRIRVKESIWCDVIYAYDASLESPLRYDKTPIYLFISVLDYLIEFSSGR